MLSPELTISREARDLLIDCCVEFIRLVSSEANEICEKETKKTIAGEHVTKALHDLGFIEYLDKIAVVVNDHKNQLKMREKKVSKFESSGLSTEELLAQQEELLRQARSRFQAQGLGQQPLQSPEIQPDTGSSVKQEQQEESVKEEQE